MIAHLDCSSGISGDKFLGALLDAGFAEDDLRTTLERLGVPSESLRIERVRSHGISAVSVRLERLADASPEPERRLAEVRTLIESAALPARVAERALRVFEVLAGAEARVHGTTPESVHFHEVGALDAILDIVGVALGIDALGIETLTATPPALGVGVVETSHGTLPVPAPATVELLLGVPTWAGPSRDGGTVAGELTTPTGAALVRIFATGFGPMPAMVAKSVGHGAGTRDIGTPNVARLIIGEPVAFAQPGFGLSLEPVTVLETNIDHLTPEQLAFCVEELLDDGALDVWQTPIVMKKGRAAVTLSLVCSPEEADRLAGRVHVLSGSLGVRRSDIMRTVAERETREITTRHGPIHVKVAIIAGVARGRAEHEDVARVARATGRAVSEIAADIAADVAEALAGP